MIRIGIVGNIGSGKTFVANNFGYPVFSADFEVAKIYKKNKQIFTELKKKLPKYITRFPIDKIEISNAILGGKQNLSKIIKIVHKEVRKKLDLFLKKNRNKKFVILDIPLIMENKIYNKNDILIFVDSKKEDINKRKDILIFVESKKKVIDSKIKKRMNFNPKLLSKVRKIQFKPDYKKRKSDFILKNKFTEKSVKKEIKRILNKIL